MGWFRSLLGQPTEGIVYGMQALTFSRRSVIAEWSRTSSTVLATHTTYSANTRKQSTTPGTILINEQIDDRHSQAVKLSHLGMPIRCRRSPRRAQCLAAGLEHPDHLGLVRAGTGPGYADADAINAKLHHLDTNTSVSPD